MFEESTEFAIITRSLYGRAFMNIPKVIHYCWFGRGPKPKLASKCIASWKKFLPDYEIVEWNEDNFDIGFMPYCQEAYEAKKYAFVSDVARFKILYDHGGVYFDTDVEIIRPLDDILARGAFMGLERNPAPSLPDGAVNPGLGLAVAPGLGLVKDILAVYEGIHFRNPDKSLNLKTVVQYTTEVLLVHGLRPKPGIMEIDGIFIYPAEYFNPKGSSTKLVITSNTRTIHHFAGSWHSLRDWIVLKTGKRFGAPYARLLGLILRNPLTIPGRVYRYWKTGQ